MLKVKELIVKMPAELWTRIEDEARFIDVIIGSDTKLKIEK